MRGAERGKLPVDAVGADHHDLARRLVERREMGGLAVAPEAEQRPLAGGDPVADVAPGVVADDEARPGPMRRDPARTAERVDQAWHG
ncbi:MAG: hypothetical protein M5U08_14085 [Burkholderiales bacterium]|nr:hypothetical protein [Burkholderiales bacterium]